MDITTPAGIQRISIWVIVISILVFSLFSQHYKTRPHAVYPRLQVAGGLSVGHFMFFFLVGIAFPDWGWLALAVGILFEFMEWIIIYGVSRETRQRVLAVIGGWFPNNGFRSPTHWLDHLVFGEYPTDHWWHPKVTDIIMNVIGFLGGRWLILSAINK